MTIDSNDILRQGLVPPKDSGIFGSEVTAADAKLIILGVPWDATSSYGTGSSYTPYKIVSESHQLDFEDPWFQTKAYEKGIFLKNLKDLKTINDKAHAKVKRVRMDGCADSLRLVNAWSLEVEKLVLTQSRHFLDQGKVVGLLGGDHSCPLGLLKALGERYQDFGVLHIDAHLDLRDSYEGFAQSHASIMFNAANSIPSLRNFVHLGIRDYCLEEKQMCRQNQAKHYVVDDRDFYLAKYIHANLKDRMIEMIAQLPANVYVSFDIDGLSPDLSPNTGTPVPGGLQFNDVCYLLAELCQQKKVIGFDLCEVGYHPSSVWDQNVGARVLYKLCQASLHDSD